MGFDRGAIILLHGSNASTSQSRVRTLGTFSRYLYSLTMPVVRGLYGEKSRNGLDVNFKWCKVPMVGRYGTESSPKTNGKRDGSAVDPFLAIEDMRWWKVQAGFGSARKQVPGLRGEVPIDRGLRTELRNGSVSRIEDVRQWKAQAGGL